MRHGCDRRDAEPLGCAAHILDALHATVRVLERVGHDVDEAAPHWDAVLLGEAVMAICATVVADAIEDRRAVTGIEPSSACSRSPTCTSGSRDGDWGRSTC